jgi:hypothetical protein
LWFPVMPLLEISQSRTLAYGGPSPIFEGTHESTAAP